MLHSYIYYPECINFYIHLPNRGTFLGSTPERLIKKNDNSDNIITSLSGYLLLLKPSQIRSKSLFTSITEAYVINDPMAVVTIHNEKELIKVLNLFQNSLET